MNFLKRLFSKKKEISKEEQYLDILANAISDVGYWSWWAENLPEVFQIEFGGTQLYFESTDKTKPPTSQIAIQFINPKSISFLTHGQLDKNKEMWFDLLHNDKIQPPSCSHESFTFIDNAEINRIIQQADEINTIFGYSPKDEKFIKERFKLAFWAGSYGFSVSAENIKLLTKEGEIKLDELPYINGQWWGYWNKYWDLKDTANPLPNDYACEVTIPLKKYDT